MDACIIFLPCVTNYKYSRLSQYTFITYYYVIASVGKLCPLEDCIEQFGQNLVLIWSLIWQWVCFPGLLRVLQNLL